MKTAGIGILSFVFLLLAGCEPGETVHFINETEMDLEITWSYDGSFDTFFLRAGDDIDVGAVGLVEGQTVHIQATAGGRMIYEESMPFEELKRRGFRIEIPAGLPAI